jgi:ABC-type multidrug transport system permease subunit
MSPKVFNIIGKNLKEMGRSKLSSLIIIIGPILIILLAGFVFSTDSLQGVKIGIFEEEDTILKENLIERFNAKSFAVQELATLQSCIDSVKIGQNHLCLQIEESQTNPLGKIEPRLNNNITLFVDYSKTRVVWTIINQVQTTIEEESSEATLHILGILSEKVGGAINDIGSKEQELNTLIDRGESIQGALEGSETDINIITNQIEVLNSDSVNAIDNLNTFNTLMLTYINEIESETGETEATSNMKWQLQQYTQETTAMLLNIQTISQQLNSNEIQNQIQTANQNLNSLITQLKSIRTSIHKISNDFNDFEETFAEEILNPIPTKYNSVAGGNIGETEKELKFFDYILPGLITMIIMFSSILLTATLTIKERKTRAYLRSILTPTSKGLFTFSNCITALIIISIQILIILSVSKLFFNSNIILPLYLTALSTIIISSFFIIIGAIMGHIFNSEETGVIASVCAGILFLISSSMIMSIEAMPKLIGKIMQYTPFVLSETLLRKIFIFQLPIINIMPELLTIMLYIVLSIVLISIIQSSQRNKETQ